MTYFELNTKVGEQVKEQIEHLKKTLKEQITEVVWTACNDYVNYADTEPLNNWRDRERADLVGEKYMLHKDSFWGKNMRNTLFEENRETILPMIKDEQIENLLNEIKKLNERLEFEINLNRSHYR